MEELHFVHVELKRETWAYPKMEIGSPDEAVTVVQNLIENLDREMVITIQVATDGSVINASVCSVGTMTQALISPAEVLRTTLLSGAHGIVMIHNHPSGSCQPSKEDLQTAKKIATACDLIGVELIDFIVIGAYGYIHSVKQNEEVWLQSSYKYLFEGIVSK